VTPFLLALLLAQPMLDVHGDSTCPSAFEVNQHLVGLVPRIDPARAGQAPHVNLSANAGFVIVELLGPDGGLLAERRLERSAPCPELAEAVAVILAAWQAKYSPLLETGAALPPAQSAAVVRSPAEVEGKRPLGFDAGLGLVRSMVEGDSVVGAKLEVAMFPFSVPLGLDVSLSVAGRHSQTIPTVPVVAQWVRPALSLGPSLRLAGRNLAADIHGNAVLALLNVRGTEWGAPLETSSSDTGVQLGLAAGLRGLWTWRYATWSYGAAWIGADLYVYPGRDRLTVGNYGEVGQLPRLELQISLGAGIGRFR
jgi:hypothetical protein